MIASNEEMPTLQQQQHQGAAATEVETPKPQKTKKKAAGEVDAEKPKKNKKKAAAAEPEVKSGSKAEKKKRPEPKTLFEHLQRDFTTAAITKTKKQAGIRQFRSKAVVNEIRVIAAAVTAVLSKEAGRETTNSKRNTMKAPQVLSGCNRINLFVEEL